MDAGDDTDASIVAGRDHERCAGVAQPLKLKLTVAIGLSMRLGATSARAARLAAARRANKIAAATASTSASAAPTLPSIIARLEL